MDEEEVRRFLVEDYPALVAAFGVGLVDRATAEDVVQEALTRAIVQARRGRRIEAPRAWVAAVARNVVRSRSRRLRAEERANARSASPPGTIETDPADRMALLEAVRRLPPRQREAVALYYFADFPIQEIADVTQSDAGAVKMNLHRARRALAEALGVTRSDRGEI